MFNTERHPVQGVHGVKVYWEAKEQLVMQLQSLIDFFITHGQVGGDTLEQQVYSGAISMTNIDYPNL